MQSCTAQCGWFQLCAWAIGAKLHPFLQTWSEQLFSNGQCSRWTRHFIFCPITALNTGMKEKNLSRCCLSFLTAAHPCAGLKEIKLLPIITYPTSHLLMLGSSFSLISPNTRHGIQSECRGGDISLLKPEDLSQIKKKYGRVFFLLYPETDSTEI